MKYVVLSLVLFFSSSLFVQAQEQRISLMQTLVELARLEISISNCETFSKKNNYLPKFLNAKTAFVASLGHRAENLGRKNGATETQSWLDKHYQSWLASAPKQKCTRLDRKSLRMGLKEIGSKRFFFRLSRDIKIQDHLKNAVYVGEFIGSKDADLSKLAAHLPFHDRQ